MKKSLIALAVVVSAVSGVAHADFQDVFSIDGTITADTYESKWEWSIGDSLTFQNTTKEMTDENKKLTITLDKPALILKGSTKEAFAVTSTGSGAVPVITFNDYKGTVVTLQNSGNEGKGYFSLPIKDSENKELGLVKVNVSYAGIAVRSGPTWAEVFSVESKNKSHIYYGGVADPTIANAQTSSNVVRKFGGVGYEALITQVTTAKPDSSNRPLQSYRGTFDMVSNSGQVISSAYALGIDSNQTIEASFNNPVLKTTTWSAPLSVLVTYN